MGLGQMRVRRKLGEGLGNGGYFRFYCRTFLLFVRLRGTVMSYHFFLFRVLRALGGREGVSLGAGSEERGGGGWIREKGYPKIVLKVKGRVRGY